MYIVVHRSFQALITLLIVSVFAFLLAYATGDPVTALSSDAVTPESRAEIRHNLGLDRPLTVQYVDFLGSSLAGDFGESFVHRRPALELLKARLPASMRLAVVATTLGTVIGVPLGMLAAIRRASIWDFGARVIALAGQSIPVFVIGLLLIWVFAVTYRLLPTSGAEHWQSYILPSLSLSALVMAGIARQVRSSMLTELTRDYVTFARIKGLHERRVMTRHVLRNSAMPAVTLAGVMMGSLLTGAVLVEALFAWPGVGRLAVDAVFERDFPVVRMCVILFTLIMVIVNLMVDILQAILDPRIRTRHVSPNA